MVMIMNSEEFYKIGLYPHNIESYKKIKEAFNRGEKVVGIVHATGTGKSYNALQLAYDNRDKKIIYITPSLGIIEHINKIIETNPNLDLRRDFSNLEFRTYQSFINMSEEELKNLNADLLIIDEFHHLGAPIWGARINKIVETHEHMQIFGMTAYTIRDRGTAYERDMANLETDELFSNKIVSRYDLCDAIIDELIPQPIYRTAYINLLELAQEIEEKVKLMDVSSDEYKEYMDMLDSAKKRIAEAPSIPELIRKNIKKNGKYIYFCPPSSETGVNDIETIKKETMEWFRQFVSEEDIVFYETTSEMGNLGKQNRNAFYNDRTLDGESANGKLRIMFAINQYNEGIHAPNIDGVIMGRGTSSDIVYFEQLGRALSVRGNTKVEYERLEKYDINYLLKLCKDKDILISENAPKKEIIQKLIAPIVIDLTNNFEFIRQLENDVKDRIKEIQIKGNGIKTEKKLREVSFDIDILNSDLFEMLSNLRDRLAPLNWEKMFELAEKYYLHYGNLETPHRFRTKNGIDFDENGTSLGVWVGNQRRRYKEQKLSDEQIDKLLSIGMNFKAKFSIRPWEETYELAEKYYFHYGNLEIPLSFKTKNGIDYDEDGISLGNWIGTQRNRYKHNKLSNDKIQKLLKIGMVFHMSVSNGDEMLELAEKYYLHYGNLEVSVGFKTLNGVDFDEKGYKLGSWIQDQREKYQNNRISNKRYKKLLKIGMRFESTFHDDHWNEMYSLAENYYLHKGDLEIPFHFKTKNGINYDENGVALGRWISDQRRNYKNQKISEDRIQKLLKIGMIFTAILDKKAWSEWYDLAKKYYLHYGNLKIPQKFKTLNGIEYDEDGVKLGTWIATQRSIYNLGKMPKERAEMLECISMVWNINKNWESICEISLQNGLDFNKFKKIISNISIQEFQSKIAFLKSNNIPLINENGILHEIFSMSSINMETKYGISLENLIKQHYIEPSKKKGV